MQEDVFRIMDGDRIVLELVRQEGGNAAALRARDEDWHTPETLDQIACVCTRMAKAIRAGV